METHALLKLITATVCAAFSVWLGWQWCLPIARRCIQRPVEPLLVRAGRIGFDEQRLRSRLFLIETSLAGLLLWGTLNYMGMFLGLTLSAIAYHLRGLILTWIVEKRERLLRSQTLGLTSALQGLVQGGMGLAPAVELLARETPAPLGSQIHRISTEFRRGRPLTEAVTAVRESLRIDAFSLLATSILCALKQGASLQSSLAGVQEALEHRDHAERQMLAKTAGSRSTIVILACTPPGFFLLFSLMMSGSMQLMFTTDYGRWMLAAILIFMYAGVAWAKRLLVLSA